MQPRVQVPSTGPRGPERRVRFCRVSEERRTLGERPARVPWSGRAAYWPVPAVLLVGVAVTVAIALISHSIYVGNENRLLNLRAKEADALLAATIPPIQTPLASAAALADVTHGNVKKFRGFIAPYVGTRPGQPFVSVSLWRLADTRAGAKTIIGAAPELLPAQAGPFFASAARSPTIAVMGLLGAPHPRLGYAYDPPGRHRYLAYGESALPPNRQRRVQGNSAFSDLNFAIYLGRPGKLQGLLLTTVKRLPLPGRHVIHVVPFGNSALTLEVSARHSLAGTLPERLPLILALTGAILTLLAALLSWRLVLRRLRAEHLAVELERTAAENRRLYSEQRNIAQTLQHALLPDSLPQIGGLEAAARYVAGEAGMEIGGDWYDVIPVGERCVVVAVGDVSGRGLRAATTMASLRFAIQAYAMERNPPDEILTKLSRLLSVTDTGQLATVLCAAIDLDSHEMTIASAGHLPPLLLVDGRARYLNGSVGVPIGVEQDSAYPTTKVAVSRGAILLAFTDGLVERKHETIDQGLARLRAVACAKGESLPDLISHVLEELHNPPAQDDTAIVGLRWTS